MRFILPHLTKSMIESLDVSNLQTRRLIRSRLQERSRSMQSPNFDWGPTGSKQAAVLLPLMMDNQGRSSILFTVRSTGLRDHSGEVSFPGGKLDDKLDQGNIVKCGLRETWEEIGVPSHKIHVLGHWYDIPSKNRRLRVTPIVAFMDVSDPLDLNINKDEVDQVLIIPIIDLLNFENVVQSKYKRKEIVVDVPSYIGDPKHRIWGLTGFITYSILKHIIFPE